MKARLIGSTRPIKQLAIEGIFDAQELIAYCARVSNPANQFNTNTSEKLIRYLIKHKHWSPLEMASATIEVTTTRDIARQLLRHRSFSFQEFSQRYADPTKDCGFVVRDARLQDPKNRQNSIDTTDDDLQKTWVMKQEQIINEAAMAYKWAIDNGIAKEQARCVLPEGNTLSTVIVNGTLRSWVHYIEVRKASGTQKEHMDLVREIAHVLSDVFPLIKENGNDD